MELHDVAQWLPMAILTAVGFFLKTLHSDLKQVIKNAAENSTKIQLLNMESNGKLDQLKEMTEVQIQSLAKQIEALAKNTHNLQKAIMHMNGNFKTHSEAMSDLYNKLDK